MLKVKGGCFGCPYEGNTLVPPDGKSIAEAKLIVVGINPGEIEERMLLPFVGRSGQLLWRELAALGIDRDDCWVTNICKCRPPRKEDGTGDEQPSTAAKKHCAKQWSEEWDGMKGKIFLLLGTLPTRHFLKRAGVSMRGSVYEKDGNKFLPTWHPSFLLRSENEHNIITWRKDLRLLPSLLVQARERKKVVWSVAKTPTEVKDTVDYFIGVNKFAVDIETTTLHPYEPGADIISISMSDGIVSKVIDCQTMPVAGELKRLLESEAGKIVQNAKFELVWLQARYGIIIKNIVFDPSSAQYLLDEGTGTSVALKQMVWKYLPDFGGYEAEVDRSNMAALEKTKLYEYNATDAYVTYKIAEILAPRIEAEGFSYLLYEVILPASYPLAEMEAYGLAVDIETVRKRRAELEIRVEELEKEILALPSIRGMEDFKITSVHDLRKLFYDKLKFAPLGKSKKTGSPTMTKEVLGGFEEGGSLEAKMIQEYKQTRKVLKTYYENYDQLVGTDGKIHTNYNMLVARGGRLTSGNPNLQNVPKDVRDIFVSSFGEDGILVQMDFKHIEMRVMACESDDEGLLRIFRAGGDPHAMIAAEILGVPIETITKEQRQAAKAVNFGLLYGMQPSTLAQREKIPIERAEQFYAGFFRKYPGVRAWHRQQEQIVESGYVVKSFFGRRRDLSSFTGGDKIKRAYNFPIQSCGSDINLYTMGLVYDMIRSFNLRAKLVATVHDSLLVDCPINEVETIRKILEDVTAELPSIFSWMKCPMNIDLQVGKNWRQASE
jgi:DNA polymerase-1